MYRSSSRSGPWSPRGRLRLLGRSPDARCVRRNWGLDTFRGRVPQWTAGAAHRHRSVLKRRSWRHRGGGRARRAHDKTCVRDGGELGRRWWAENASRYGRAGPRGELFSRNRSLRRFRPNRAPNSQASNHHPGPPPVSQSENSESNHKPRTARFKELVMRRKYLLSSYGAARWSSMRG